MVMGCGWIEVALSCPTQMNEAIRSPNHSVHCKNKSVSPMLNEIP